MNPKMAVPDPQGDMKSMGKAKMSMASRGGAKGMKTLPKTSLMRKNSMIKGSR